MISLPVIAGFVYVRVFGVDAPYKDTWTMVPYFDRLFSGTQTVGNLFVQYNEHRAFFPRIVMLMVGAATAFDTVVVLYLIQLCFLATLIVLFLAFRQSVARSPLLFAPVPFLVFSLGQPWNMLQAFQLTLIFVQTFGVLSFYLLHLSGSGGRRRLAFPAAVGSGMVATFSSAPGLAVWPVGLLQVLILPTARRTKGLLAAAWGLAGAAAWLFYSRGYSEPRDYTESRYASGEDHIPEFFLTTLGSSLFRERDLGLALAAGLLLGCLIAVGLLCAYRDRSLGECSFWMAIVSFSLAILATTTLARAGSGLDNAVDPKYVCYSVLAVIGTYAMLVRSALEWRQREITASVGVLVALVALSAPFSAAQAIDRGQEIKAVRERAAFVVATHENQSDEALTAAVRPGVELSRERVSVLDKLDYSLFSEPRPWPLPPPVSGLSPVSSDAPSGMRASSGSEASAGDGRLVVPEGNSYIDVSGWAVDAGAEDAAGGAYVAVDGRPFPAFYGTRTAGVAERLGDPAYEDSGFERSIPVSEIGPGTHELSLIVVTSDEEGYYRSDQEIEVEVSRHTPE